jgi:trk system potassium uptake protein TrkA
MSTHECTVVDLDPARLKDVSNTLDVRVVRGDGAGREALQPAEVKRADLVLACMPRDEANLVTQCSCGVCRRRGR